MGHTWNRLVHSIRFLEASVDMTETQYDLVILYLSPFTAMEPCLDDTQLCLLTEPLQEPTWLFPAVSLLQQSDFLVADQDTCTPYMQYIQVSKTFRCRSMSTTHSADPQQGKKRPYLSTTL